MKSCQIKTRTDLGVLEAVTTAVTEVTRHFICAGLVIIDPVTSAKACKYRTLN